MIDRYVKALSEAHEIAERFEQAFGRLPTREEVAIAATFYIEANKREKAEVAKNAAKLNEPPGSCGICGGPIYDNRADKASGEKSHKWPDFKCRDPDCKWAVWLDSKSKKKAPEPEHPRGPVHDPEGADLPF